MRWLLATQVALLQPTYMPSPSVVPTEDASRPVWWMWLPRMMYESVLPLFRRRALLPVS